MITTRAPGTFPRSHRTRRRAAEGVRTFRPGAQVFRHTPRRSSLAGQRLQKRRLPARLGRPRGGVSPTHPTRARALVWGQAPAAAASTRTARRSTPLPERRAPRVRGAEVWGTAGTPARVLQTWIRAQTRSPQHAGSKAGSLWCRRRRPLPRRSFRPRTSRGRSACLIAYYPRPRRAPPLRAFLPAGRRRCRTSKSCSGSGRRGPRSPPLGLCPPCRRRRPRHPRGDRP